MQQKIVAGLQTFFFSRSGAGFSRPWETEVFSIRQPISFSETVSQKHVKTPKQWKGKGKKTKGNNKTKAKEAAELTETRRHRTGKPKQEGIGTRTGPKLGASNEESDGKKKKISSSE